MTRWTSAVVRTRPSNEDQKNFTGLLWCATNSQHVENESWLERDRMIFLDRDPTIIGIASQPFRPDFQLDGIPCFYVPGYFAKAFDGPSVVVDVRPDDHIDAHDHEIFAATATIGKSVGWGYQRVGALPHVLAANLHWLVGYKHPRCRTAVDAHKITG